MADDEEPEIVRKVDSSKRAFVRAAIAGTVFLAPVVTTFTMSGIMLDSSKAQATHYFNR